MPVSPPHLVAALAVTFLAATVQGTIGIGLGMLSVPILTLVDPTLTPVPQLIVTLPLTVAMFRGERQSVEWRSVLTTALARVPGIAVGIVLLSVAAEEVLDAMIGGIVLGAVVVIATGVTVTRNRTSEIVAGAVSGATGTISSIGGPPLALLYRNDTGPTVRSNLAAIFFVGISMILVARSATGHVSWTDLQVAAWLAPMVAAGYLLSRRLTGRVEGGLLRAAILVVSAAAAVGLLVRTAVG